MNSEKNTPSAFVTSHSLAVTAEALRSDASILRHLVVATDHGARVLLLFDIFLQLLDLILKELAEELTKLIERDLTRLIVV